MDIYCRGFFKLIRYLCALIGFEIVFGFLRNKLKDKFLLCFYKLLSNSNSFNFETFFCPSWVHYAECDVDFVRWDTPGHGPNIYKDNKP